MGYIMRTTFSNVFSWLKTFQFKIQLKYVPKGLIHNISSDNGLVQLGNKALSEPMLTSSTDAYGSVLLPGFAISW